MQNPRARQVQNLTTALKARVATGLLLLAALMVVIFIQLRPAGAVEPAEAATKPPVSVDIFVSTRNDLCYDRGDIAAIRRMTALETERINAQSGIAGHKLEVRIRDDFRDANRATSGMREALASPDTVAMLGLSSSDRSKAVFEAAGEDIKKSGIPFISAISVNEIFADAPNVFTMRASQDDERLPVMVQFARQSGFTKAAFLGLRDSLFSSSLGNGLGRALGAALIADHRLSLVDDKLEPAALDAAIADLREKAPDIVYLAIGMDRNADVVSRIKAAGLTPAIFVSGRISSLPKELIADYTSPLYEVVWDRLPAVYSDRLMRRLDGEPPGHWLFGGEKNNDAPGWAKGECKPQGPNTDVLSDNNLRAIAIGTQYADMLGLIAAAARAAPRDAELREIRALILEQLRTAYAAGRGVYQGAYENWSFVPGSRSASRSPFIVQKVPGLEETQLAPLQFTRLREEKLRAIPTQFMDIDLVRIFSIDDNEKIFDADFYLSLRDDGAGNSIDLFEFANAIINPETNDRQVTVRVLSDGSNSEVYPEGMKIYQVTGRFLFQPDLQAYPFDTQRFSIDIRPKQGDKPFIVQPPPQTLRDTTVRSHGWSFDRQFVGYDEDFVTTVDARTHQPSVVPFYKASFVWLMARETTDYFLRVVVPLLFILTVAYLSIFIPLSHFEAIVTIQVTALLSAVALYLSLPEINGDVTTVSDRIFLFNYMATTLMIGISVMRINGFVTARPLLGKVLMALHVFAVPALALVMGFYVYRASLGAG